MEDGARLRAVRDRPILGVVPHEAALPFGYRPHDPAGGELGDDVVDLLDLEPVPERDAGRPPFGRGVVAERLEDSEVRRRVPCAIQNRRVRSTGVKGTDVLAISYAPSGSTNGPGLCRLRPDFAFFLRIVHTAVHVIIGARAGRCTPAEEPVGSRNELLPA